jgi:predicted esterase
MPNDITTHHVAVTRTARYAVTGAAPIDTTELWLVLHGYGQRAADFIAPFAEAAPTGTRVLAAEGLSRFYLELPRSDGGHLHRTGATWLTRDDRDEDIRDTLGMLDAVVDGELAGVRAAHGGLPRLHLLGFSQGVAMSMRWAADRGARAGANVPLATHVLWAGGLAHDVTDDAMRAAWGQTAVHVVTGERDRFASETFRRAITERLTAIGQPLTTHTFAGGHRLHTPLLHQLMSEAMA